MAKLNASTSTSSSLPPSLSKHIQELSVNGDEPLERYIIKDTNFGAMISSPASFPIPIIDISLLSSSPSSKEESDELNKLKSALITFGCFQAIGHGITNPFLEEVRGSTKQFFALPMKEKQKNSRVANDMEGYRKDPIISEKQVLDWSERIFLNIFPEHHRKLKLWPETPSDFRGIIHEYSKKMSTIMDLLIKAMARSLDLEENSFSNQFGDEAVTQARFNYYLTCPRPDLVLGARAHSDGTGITILLQDKEVEGLQVLKDDQWIKVPIIPDALLVNIGDQMQIMSNGIFKSPIHRVVTNAERERISLATFYVPNPETEIEPNKGLVDDERPQLYKKYKNYFSTFFESLWKEEIALDALKMIKG